MVAYEYVFSVNKDLRIEKSKEHKYIKAWINLWI